MGYLGGYCLSEVNLSCEMAIWYPKKLWATGATYAVLGVWVNRGFGSVVSPVFITITMIQT